jgi:hypothetical protein
MKGARFFRVDYVAFVKEVVVAELRWWQGMSTDLTRRLEMNATHLVTKEAPWDVDFLASYNDNLLAVQNLLGNNGRQPTKKVTLAIDDDGGRRNGGHERSEDNVSEKKRVIWR